MNKIKILLVEDNAIVRKGIVNLLGTQEDMEVIAQAASGRKVMDLLQSGLRPDIILADLNMPEMDGIELTRRICALEFSDVNVIMLTMHAKQIFVDEAFKAGAKGYLLKNGDFDELYKGIRQVYQKQPFISDDIRSSNHYPPNI